MKVTEKNWSEKKEIAKRYQLPLLTKKCVDFASEIIQKDIHLNEQLTSVGTYWLQECIGMGKLENNDLINLLIPNITIDNLQLLFGIAKQHNAMLLEACNNFIQFNPVECIINSKNEWMRKILMDLSDEDYSKFLINIHQSKIQINNVRILFEFAQNKKDKKLLEASIRLIGSYMEQIKDLQLWSLEEIPDEILPLLYPSKG